MKNFRFLDDKSDVEGMKYIRQTMAFNGTHFKVEYYTDLPPEDCFEIQMHIYGRLGMKNMELEENVNSFRVIMNDYYHRVIIEEIDADTFDFEGFIENID